MTEKQERSIHDEELQAMRERYLKNRPAIIWPARKDETREQSRS